MITVFTKLLGIALLHLLKSKVPACFAITWSAAVCNVLAVDLLSWSDFKAIGNSFTALAEKQCANTFCNHVSQTVFFYR